MEQLGRLLGEVGVVIPGMGFAIQRAFDLASHLQQRREATQRLRSEVTLDDGTTGLGVQLAFRVLELCEAVPPVVVIEDAHWADDALCEFVRTLTTSQKKVLVLATVWPEGMTSTGPLHRFAALQVELEATSSAVRKDVTPPPQPDRSDLVRDFAASAGWSVPDEVVQTLAARYVTPLGISLAMTSDFMREFVEDGCRREDLQDLPQALESLYARRWQELDPDIQDALVLAVLLSPLGATRHASSDGRMSLVFVLEVLKRVNDQRLPPSAEVAAGYRKAKEDAAWLIDVAAIAEQFREPELARIATDEAYTRFRRSRRSHVVSTYIEVLRSVLADPQSPALALAAEHYLTLDEHLEDIAVPDDEHLARAARVVASGLMLTYQFQEAIGVLRGVKDRVEPAVRAPILDDLVRICIQSSMYADAAQYSLQLLAGRAPLRERYDSETARILADHSRAELELHHNQAIEGELHEILRVLPAQLDVPTIRLRRLYANSIRGDRRRVDVALSLLRDLLGDIVEQRPEQDDPTWDEQEAYTRMAIVIALQRLGRLEEALPEVDRVVEMRERQFGRESLPVFAAVGQKVSVLNLIRGRRAEAAALRVELYERRRKVLGNDHPHVLRRRHAVALAAIDEDPQWAARELTAVHQAKAAVLGPTHMSTVNSLSASARAWRMAGDVEKSLALYDEAVRIRRQTDSTQKWLVTRRKRLATLRLIDCATALVEADSIVTAAEELGPEAVGTLRARFQQAETVAHCQSRSAGLTLHEQVLVDRRAWLDPSHADIAASEAALAKLLV